MTPSLAHIRRVRAGYERIRGRLPEARRLLDEVTGVFRAAGDIRCLIRSLVELARFHLAGRVPAITTDLRRRLLAPPGQIYADEGRAGGRHVLLALYEPSGHGRPA